ncbi:MAG: ribose-phosphate pyrophosphokinase [Candidatus Marinimicrobia bacterium]|nr:ribose-phosphate pyrophosphokinase [Candidatus Neomarinimicrobiota bacterium]|tara:strand:- start:777 stop:1709 length:933 start_codon:yes stop_codon:yes gene_type:complete
MKVFSGRSNIKLAKGICDSLGIPLGEVTIKDFSDGEMYVAFNENIRNEDVFIIQSTNSPSSHLLEMLLMLDAAKRASARTVVAVIPYFGYARQDRKDKPRVPISSRLILDLICAAGVDRIITMDLHSPQIQGFVNIPFDHLYSRIALLDHVKKMELDEQDGVVLSPDIGSAPMSQSYAKKLGIGFALIDKRRTGHNKAEIANLIGNLKNKHAIIIDDMIDTAGTICNAADIAIEKGALSVTAMATHPVLSGEAIQRLENSSISKVIVGDTIELKKDKIFNKLEIITVEAVFADAIRHIVDGTSLSSMFKI